jgi:hypothetical protein
MTDTDLRAAIEALRIIAEPPDKEAADAIGIQARNIARTALRAIDAAPPAPLDVERLEAAVFSAAFTALDDRTQKWLGFEEVTRRIDRAYATEPGR